jgi:hypothetical protein
MHTQNTTNKSGDLADIGGSKGKTKIKQPGYLLIKTLYSQVDGQCRNTILAW